MLGEMEAHGPACEIRGQFAYAAQSAFIVNGTVRENVLFGHEFDQGIYDETLEGCCLLPDLKILRGGDACEIGESGINLSGGQKQRLSLARCVYAALLGKADILLLDDVLSAVDAHVGAHIMERCIVGMFQNSKTVVLVTHAIQYRLCSRYLG